MFANYCVLGERSNKKLIPIHAAIAQYIRAALEQSLLPEIFLHVTVVGYPKKEQQVTGSYMDHNVDIAINYRRQPIYILSYKAIGCNFKQNAHSYFSLLRGECAEFREQRIGVVSFFTLPEAVPYFKRSGALQKVEMMTYEDIRPWVALNEDAAEQNHNPSSPAIPNHTIIDPISFTPNLPVILGFRPSKLSRTKLSNAIGFSGDPEKTETLIEYLRSHITVKVSENIKTKSAIEISVERMLTSITSSIEEAHAKYEPEVADFT